MNNTIGPAREQLNPRYGSPEWNALRKQLDEFWNVPMIHHLMHTASSPVVGAPPVAGGTPVSIAFHQAASKMLEFKRFEQLWALLEREEREGIR